MGRHHRPDLEYVWRGVITHRYANGNEHVEYCGPFTAKGHIRSSNYPTASDVLVIQRSKLDWETVEIRGENDEPEE